MAADASQHSGGVAQRFRWARINTVPTTNVKTIPDSDLSAGKRPHINRHGANRCASAALDTFYKVCFNYMLRDFRKTRKYGSLRSVVAFTGLGLFFIAAPRHIAAF